MRMPTHIIYGVFTDELEAPSRILENFSLSSSFASLSPHFSIAGTIALSGKLAESLEALYNARIPRDWLAKSWEASTLGSWFAGLLARHEQLLRWLKSGRPKAYWLTGFFNPQVQDVFSDQQRTFQH